jgi:hypothetical protein
MVQLENLQVAANVATTAVNAWGALLINRLHDIPACTQEIALHGVHCGMAVALAVAQVQTGHDLLSMEPGFPMVDDPDMHEDLIEDFDDAAATIEDIIPA